jgi:hypothetical protein
MCICSGPRDICERERFLWCSVGIGAGDMGRLRSGRPKAECERPPFRGLAAENMEIFQSTQVLFRNCRARKGMLLKYDASPEAAPGSLEYKAAPW